MPLSSFHPIVARWFTETLGAPTPAQRLGWAAIRERRHTLIAAPTGSGKTLAAFLTALDDLFQEGLTGPLPDEVRLLYVSPLKALSADIHKNLAEPRRGIRQLAEREGLAAPRITAAVRTGDTTQADRAAMLKRPPHILVTTPESLYLLLTAERGREMLRTVRTVVVDEIHAVIGTRRGAHLALSLERLQRVAQAPLVRLGLSATQKPIADVARFLVGTAGVDARNQPDCVVVDEGHRRAMDLAIETPRSALEAVMSHEIWEEYYDRLLSLIDAHRTTLVFVNTRRMAERLARRLSERLGEAAVTAHHGSLSKETRLDAEARLKGGQLKALVATASLELGIDIGSVDLVCQIGSPHRIATLLQRVGRSGHSVSGTPKGRVFPTSRDDLIECAALLRAVRRGELDRIVSHDAPLDVLAQQIVAETACEECGEDELFAWARGAWPYRALTRTDFDAVVRMTAEGFATRRGRRGALVHRDEVQARVRGRRGARLLAITAGGAIPEVADYRVLLEPQDTFVGTLNEDFAIESNAGDVFQLGNAAWRVLRVGAGTVRVADAKGAPPNLPFWLGEAPGRSDELSRAVSDLRADIERQLSPAHADTDAGAHGDTAALAVLGSSADENTDQSANANPSADVDADAGAVAAAQAGTLTDMDAGACARADAAIDWLIGEVDLSRDAAEQVIAYLAEGRRLLGALPTQETLVLERFFDESGGMQLVLHAPFGSRINKAWGLALRKRFCRQFNFELQAAATEDALLLSLGPQHSFPLADVFRYLHPATARDVLVQAFLDAPVFQTRWRWNTTIALAVPRSRGGRKVPPPLQRMQADDLMAAVFPDAAACLENIPGDREVPDHPLVGQTIRDCLQEAMDFDGLTAVLERIHRGELRCLSRDTPEPSPLSHEILNARPYAFLDDAPLEERRAHAVYARRANDPSAPDDLGALDAAAIERVRDEVRVEPRDADELHDALLTAGLLTDEELADVAPALCAELAAARRATHMVIDNDVDRDEHGVDGRTSDRKDARAGDRSRAVEQRSGNSDRNGDTEGGGARGFDEAERVDRGRRAFWVAAERLPELLALHPSARRTPDITAPASRSARVWTRADALVEILRGRVALAGPATARQLAAPLGVSSADLDAALLALEGEGVVLRGQFTPAAMRSRSPQPRTPRQMPSHTAPGTRAARELEWCDRALLARIHRYTLHRLRAEIEPVSPADFTRFLFVWQQVDPASRLTGVDGLRAIIGLLDGFEAPAAAWESSLLPARIDRYESSMLDMLCLTGEVGWARLSSAAAGERATPRATSASSSADASGQARLASTVPIALFLREHGDAWQALRGLGDRGATSGVSTSAGRDTAAGTHALGEAARALLDLLHTRGASFSRELAAACAQDEATLRRAICELVAAGRITSDGFAGVRGLIRTARKPASTLTRHIGATRRTAAPAASIDLAGRWSALREIDDADARHASRTEDMTPATSAAHAARLAQAARDEAIEQQAWALLHRYGVVFRRLLTREANAASWRDLTRIYRRLEARGDIRGGRFVAGMSGEQFALGEAVDRLREVRRTAAHGRLLVVSAADPLNLAGIVTPGDRVRAVSSSRIVYRDGVPLAAMEGDYLRPLADIPAALAADVASALAGRRVPPVISGYIGRTG